MTPLQVPQEDAELIREALNCALDEGGGCECEDDYVCIVCTLAAALSALARAQPAQGEALELPEAIVEGLLRVEAAKRPKLPVSVVSIMQLVRAALEGDAGRVEGYADWLAAQLEAGHPYAAKAIREMLAGIEQRTVHTADAASPPAQAADETVALQLEARAQELEDRARLSSIAAAADDLRARATEARYLIPVLIAALQAQGQGEPHD